MKGHNSIKYFNNVFDNFFLQYSSCPQVYIVARAAQGTPSRRHLFLGQCLLLGLLLSSLIGLPLALEPSVMSCAAVRWVPALVYIT